MCLIGKAEARATSDCLLPKWWLCPGTARPTSKSESHQQVLGSTCEALLVSPNLRIQTEPHRTLRIYRDLEAGLEFQLKSSYLCKARPMTSSQWPSLNTA